MSTLPYDESPELPEVRIGYSFRTTEKVCLISVTPIFVSFMFPSEVSGNLWVGMVDKPDTRNFKMYLL